MLEDMIYEILLLSVNDSKLMSYCYEFEVSIELGTD